MPTVLHDASRLCTSTGQRCDPGPRGCRGRLVAVEVSPRKCASSRPSSASLRPAPQPGQALPPQIAPGRRRRRHLPALRRRARPKLPGSARRHQRLGRASGWRPARSLTPRSIFRSMIRLPGSQPGEQAELPDGRSAVKPGPLPARHLTDLSRTFPCFTEPDTGLIRSHNASMSFRAYVCFCCCYDSGVSDCAQEWLPGPRCRRVLRAAVDGTGVRGNDEDGRCQAPPLRRVECSSR